MPGRQANLGSYRYGFQNQETDPEMLGGAVAFKYRVHDVRIGRFLSVDPVAKSYPTFSPYSFVQNSPIKFKDLEGAELYVTGTVANDFINMLASKTGLILTQDANGMLTYATQTITLYKNPTDPNTITEFEVPVPNNPNSSEVDISLQRLTMNIINQKTDRVDIIALTREEIKSKLGGVDQILFDQFPFTEYDPNHRENPKNGMDNTLDMTDFNAVKKEPEFQTAMLAHVLEERASASKGYDKAHQAGLELETANIQKIHAGAKIRQNRAPSLLFGRSEFPSAIFDYGVVSYELYAKGHSNKSKESAGEVTRVKEITKK